jgi:hypothetical protein
MLLLQLYLAIDRYFQVKVNCRLWLMDIDMHCTGLTLSNYGKCHACSSPAATCSCHECAITTTSSSTQSSYGPCLEQNQLVLIQQRQMT